MCSTLKRIVALTSLLSLSLLASAAERKHAGKPARGPVVQNVQTNRATISWGTTNGELDVHSIELTGLKPGRHYDIDLDRYGANAEVSFETAPSDAAPFSFVVFGDTRDRDEVHKKIVDLILKEHPSFVIHTGDLVGDGNANSDWDRFFQIEQDLLRTAAFYPMLRNHEKNSSAYHKYYSFPNGNGHRYSFNWGTVHFAVLDTNEFGEDSFDEQVNWLKYDLDQSKQPLTFVAFHHPLYTAVEGRRISAAKLAARLEPVLLAAGVTAVSGGHDHNYQHHIKDSIHYIVAGGGGAPLYDGSPIPGLTVKLAKIENFVRVRIKGNQAHVDAFDIEGRLVDSFGIGGRKANPSIDAALQAPAGSR